MKQPPLLSLFLFVWVSLLAFSTQAEVKGDGSKANPLEINWENLIPEGFEPDVLLKKYEKDLIKLESLPDDSEEGMEIIQRIQAEIDMIPSNSKLDGKWVRLPGFIAPLKIQNASVKKFLLVPYFGACIHVPPPPVNQTVLVEILAEQGIRLHEVDYAFMVTGQIHVDRSNTDIGNAGYRISQASVEIHHDTRWMEVE